MTTSALECWRMLKKRRRNRLDDDALLTMLRSCTDLNAAVVGENTMLNLAAERRLHHAVRLLLAAGASVEHSKQIPAISIIHAVRYNWKCMVRMLLAAGANVNVGRDYY